MHFLATPRDGCTIARSTCAARIEKPLGLADAARGASVRNLSNNNNRRVFGLGFVCTSLTIWDNDFSERFQTFLQHEKRSRLCFCPGATRRMGGLSNEQCTVSTVVGVCTCVFKFS